MSGLDTVELVLRDFSTWLRRLFLASLSRNDSASEGADSFVFPSEPLSLARHLRRLTRIDPLPYPTPPSQIRNKQSSTRTGQDAAASNRTHYTA